MEFYLWLAAYVIVGVPVVGYLSRQLVRLGKHMYQRFPAIRAFFDTYWENYGIGLGLTVVGVLCLVVGRWMGWV
jgi:hypothetical protein